MCIETFIFSKQFIIVGKEDGKFCKKVTVRMTIRKNDCRSNTPVSIEPLLFASALLMFGSHAPIKPFYLLGFLCAFIPR